MFWTASRWRRIFPIGKMSENEQGATPVKTLEDLGNVIRRLRREKELDQATAAGLAGVGTRFLGDVERGKPTVRLGLVLQVLHRLGLELWIAPRSWRPRGG
jgi:y4mF family transcriptional regulator